MTRTWLTLVLAMMVAVPAAAQTPWQDPDEEGCRDSKLVTRLPGCRIESCTTRDFDAREVIVGKYDSDKGEHPKKTLEGAVEEVVYVCSPKASALQIGRNMENALRKAGFTMVLAGQDDVHYRVTAQKGAQWVSIDAAPVNDYFTYTQTAVLVKEMAQDVEADASAMADAINRTGSVAVYGINFDTGQATLQAGSEKVLGEIVKLMKDRTDWKFEVQGHTDNVGQKAANMTLSEQRARTVVGWLTKNGVDAARLVAKGYGDTVPVADNGSDEGKAKNRRVELKKLNEE